MDTTTSRIKWYVRVADRKSALHGKLCPACFERTPADVPDVFLGIACGIIHKDTCHVAYRLQPIPQAVEKRGMEFLRQDDNWVICCCLECKREYEEFWKYHPKRKDLIAKLERSGK